MEEEEEEKNKNYGMVLMIMRKRVPSAERAIIWNLIVVRSSVL